MHSSPSGHQLGSLQIGTVPDKSTMRKVIIVEDEADIAGLIKFNLEAAGYKTERFERAEPALASALESPPALMLLDIMLPGLDGLELCRQMRSIEELSR